jgi:hypothetical protein
MRSDINSCLTDVVLPNVANEKQLSETITVKFAIVLASGL